MNLRTELTKQEIVSLARGVKPSLSCDAYLVQQMQAEGVWPWADQNTGYIPKPEWKEDTCPEQIRKMLELGGNPFIVDGNFSVPRLNMGYEKALAEQKRLQDEAATEASEEANTATDPAANPSEPAAESIEDLASQHPVGENIGAHFGQPVTLQDQRVPGPPQGNVFVGGQPEKVTTVAEVTSEDDLVDPTTAFSTSIPVDNPPPGITPPVGIETGRNGLPIVIYIDQLGQRVRGEVTWEQYHIWKAQGYFSSQEQQQYQYYQAQQPGYYQVQQPGYYQVQQAQQAPSSIQLRAEEPPKPPKPQKAKADPSVTPPAAGPAEILTNTRAVPEIVQDASQEAKAPVEHTVPQKPISLFQQNASLYSNKQTAFLRDIEQVALENGCQVRFMPHVSPMTGNYDNLIEVAVYDISGRNLNKFKSFTIDLGRIIDGRQKLYRVFPIGNTLLEEHNPFELFVKGGTKATGGGKRLDVDLLKTVFVGGTSAINRMPMYSREMLTLNRYVDMSTVKYPPDKGDTKGMKPIIRDKFLLSCLDTKRDVFGKILRQVPGSRFAMIEKYNPQTKTIKLSNVGVPAYYNGPVIAQVPITLTLKEGEAEWVIQS